MEQQPNIENFEKSKAKIVLHFFRHDEKESDKSKTDEEIRLTSAGREHAISLSNPETNLEQSLAFGSPRKRTQETAGLVMAGHQDDITGEETLEELKEKLNKDLGYGSKLHTDSRLDFKLNESGEYLEEGLLAFKEGRFLKWLVEESDEKFIQYGMEKDYFSYSNQARQIALVIEKYLGILPRWSELVSDPSKKYEPELERFLGTHQSISECFLAKVIELTRGEEERDRFVKALGNQGFNYAEGFEVDIEESQNGEPEIHIKYKKESESPEETYEIDEVLSSETLSTILG
jgi:hypothetical protein